MTSETILRMNKNEKIRSCNTKERQNLFEHIDGLRTCSKEYTNTDIDKK